jgi:hypothetical protein
MADVTRLKGEVERLEMTMQEALIAQQVSPRSSNLLRDPQLTIISYKAKFNVELLALREQYEDSERRCRTAELDMVGLREKVEKARLDSMQESEETMSELKNFYEREKSLLIEETKRLQFEYEKSVELNNRLQLERRQVGLATLTNFVCQNY